MSHSKHHRNHEAADNHVPVPQHQAKPTHSPSRTEAERDGHAPEDHRPNPQQLAQDHGRDPLPNKHEDHGGCPGGSPGRRMDSDAVHDPQRHHGACAPEPVGAKDHHPGEFEQPAREEPRGREFGDWAG